MGVISRIKTWASGNKLTAADLNAEFNNILSLANGNISDANVNASADINGTKLLDASLTSRKLKPTVTESIASGSLSLTTNFADVAGTSQTLTLSTNSTILVIGTFELTVAGGNTGLGALHNGTTQEPEYAEAVGAAQGTYTQIWLINLSAGSRTIKLQAKSTGGGGTCGITHTKMISIVISQ